MMGCVITFKFLGSSSHDGRVRFSGRYQSYGGELCPIAANDRAGIPVKIYRRRCDAERALEKLDRTWTIEDPRIEELARVKHRKDE